MTAEFLVNGFQPIGEIRRIGATGIDVAVRHAVPDAEALGTVHPA